MSKNNEVSFGVGCATVIIVMFIALAGLFGWVKNIYRLAQTDFQAPYKAEVLRGIGIFVPPMGAIEGYINIED
jgi:hypothetical protein